MVTPVTCRALDMMSGIISTPTFKDFAVKKGDLLKAGSSAMERSSAASDPENNDRLRLPTLTGRPRAAVSFSSIVGRNWLGLRKKGMAMRTSTSTPKAIRT